LAVVAETGGEGGEGGGVFLGGGPDGGEKLGVGFEEDSSETGNGATTHRGGETGKHRRRV